MMKQSEFQHKLFYGLLHDSFEYQLNNRDYLRFNIKGRERLRAELKDAVFFILKKLGLVSRHFNMNKAGRRLKYFIRNMEHLETVYGMLGDDYSKHLFIEVLKFRTLGSAHVKLPANNRFFWRMYHSVDEKYLREKATTDTGRFVLDMYEIHGSNGPMKIHATSLGILAVFLLEQYGYNRVSQNICAEPGETVIDGGACWGETSLYFADKVGPLGRVYAFEFVDGNVRVLEKNLRLNGQLRDRVELVKSALWRVSGESLSYSERGPSTCLLGATETDRHLKRTGTVAIDDFVKEREIPRVDFIKMDIEGAEMDALLGAEETIKRFTPKLAISIYHKEDDLFEIPSAIHELNPNYEYYLDHFTIHNEETVLFCRPRNS